MLVCFRLQTRFSCFEPVFSVLDIWAWARFSDVLVGVTEPPLRLRAGVAIAAITLQSLPDKETLAGGYFPLTASVCCWLLLVEES